MSSSSPLSLSSLPPQLRYFYENRSPNSDEIRSITSTISPSPASPSDSFFHYIHRFFPSAFRRWSHFIRDGGGFASIADYGAIAGGAIWVSSSRLLFNNFIYGKEGRELDIPYANDIRCKLDVFYSHRLAQPKRSTFNNPPPLSPVVFFIHGGGWGSGSKYLYRLLAHRFDREGYISVCVNYNLWPSGDVRQQMSDCEDALYWVYQNIKKYGGDPEKIVLAGHSSGGHLSLLLTLRRLLPSARDCDYSYRIPAPIRGVISLSTPTDLSIHYLWEWARSVHMISPLQTANGGIESFPNNSPAQLVTKIDRQRLLKGLPPILLLHGANDTTVPYQASLYMVQKLIESMQLKKAGYIMKMGESPSLDNIVDIEGRVYHAIMKDVDHASIITDLMAHSNRHHDLMAHIHQFMNAINKSTFVPINHHMPPLSKL